MSAGSCRAPTSRMNACSPPAKTCSSRSVSPAAYSADDDLRPRVGRHVRVPRAEDDHQPAADVARPGPATRVVVGAELPVLQPGRVEAHGRRDPRVEGRPEREVAADAEPDAHSVGRRPGGCARKSSTATRSASNCAVVVAAAPASPAALPASSNSSATPASSPAGRSPARTRRTRTTPAAARCAASTPSAGRCRCRAATPGPRPPPTGLIRTERISQSGAGDPYLVLAQLHDVTCGSRASEACSAAWVSASPHS